MRDMRLLIECRGLRNVNIMIRFGIQVVDPPLPWLPNDVIVADQKSFYLGKKSDLKVEIVQHS
jgi:hypothetical protein